MTLSLLSWVNDPNRNNHSLELIKMGEKKKEIYCIADDIWPSRRWNKGMTSYIDLSGDRPAVQQIGLSEDEIKKLNKLWFIYGNNGRKHSHCNHRFIQNLLEKGEDTRLFYLSSAKNDLSDECLYAVDDILE